MKKDTLMLTLMMVLFAIVTGCVQSPSLTSAPEKPIPTPTIIQPTSASAHEGRIVVVTSTSDNGLGSLREALLLAQRGDTINFDPVIFPADAPATIYISEKLPINQDEITIDANNAGVILDGRDFNQNSAPALVIWSDGNSIQGLHITNFPDVGIGINNGASDNIIGPGNTIANNGGVGVEIANPGSLHNTVTRNIIYGNSSLIGINLMDGGNNETYAPLIIEYNLDVGTIIGTICPFCTVEIFSDTGRQGEIFEGKATADRTGAFVFIKDAGFAGPHITVTSTDQDGNTSSFSIPTNGLKGRRFLQEGNQLPLSRTAPLQSSNLEDNRIGDMYSFWDRVFIEPPDFFAEKINNSGLKWMRISLDSFDWQEQIGRADFSTFNVLPAQDDAINRLHSIDMNLIYVLVFWDEAFQDEVERNESPRYKTPEEIENYLEYVQFIVHQFKNKIAYYEILNEPNTPNFGQYVEVEDYINLVMRAIPVIREEDPTAKIVVGTIPGLWESIGKDYFFEILNSEAMPLIDAISWHPMYGTSPECKPYYYYDYPSFVEEIKTVASSNGFEGEYIAEELQWRSHEDFVPGVACTYSDIVAAKYLARGVISHLGMDVTVGLAENLGIPPKQTVIQNLSTLMAGAKPIELSVEIETSEDFMINYNFGFANGDRLVTLWKDDVAVEEDRGVSTTLTFTGLSAYKVIGIDILNGTEQEIITTIEDGSLVIRDILVKDYPIILRLIDTNL